MTEGKCERDLGRETELQKRKDGQRIEEGSGVEHNLLRGSRQQNEGVPMAASKVWSRASR